MESSFKALQWINILPCLRSVGFKKNVILRYQDRPNNFPKQCYGCESIKPFTVQHNLQYKSWGLFMGSHNKVYDSLYLMVTHDFSSYSLWNKLILYSILVITKKSDQHTSKIDNITVKLYPEHEKNWRGYLYIHHMW